jgi:VanZ family protein
MALIFILSAQPGLRVTEDASVDRPIRTIAHLGTFGLLGALLFRAFLTGRRRPARAAAYAAIVAVIYAVSDELHQAFVPDRTGRAQDVVVDAIGAAVGIVVASVVLVVERRRRASGAPPEPG